jgi:hypothetical protein
MQPTLFQRIALWFIGTKLGVRFYPAAAIYS